MMRRACAVAALCSFLQMGWAQTTATAPAKLSSNEVMSRLKEADKLYNAGKDKEALAILNEVVPQTDLPLARWARAQLLVKAKDFKGALADIDALIAVDDKNLQYYVARGQICSASDDFEGAVAALEKAQALATGAPPQFKAQLYAALGEAKIKTKDTAGAIRDFSELVKLLPTDPRAYRLRANAYIAAEKYAAAITDLNSTIDLTQRIAKANAASAGEAAKIEQEAVELRTSLRLKAKDYGGTIRDHELLLRKKPADKVIEDTLVAAVTALKFEGGKAPFTPATATEVNANRTANKNAYAEIEKKLVPTATTMGFAMGTRSYADAEKAASEGLAIAPDAATYRGRGEARFALGKYVEAARDYRLAAAMYCALWASESTANFRALTNAEACMSWADYAIRKAENQLTDADKKYEAAVADEAAGRPLEAYLLVRNVYTENYAHRPMVALYDRLHGQREKLRPQFMARAQKAFAAGNMDEARRYGEGAMVTGSYTQSDAYLLLARVELQANNEKKVKDYVSVILMNDFEDGTANLIQGDMYAKAGKQNDALLAYSAGSKGTAATTLTGDAKTCAEKRDAIEATLGKKGTDDFYVNAATSALRDKRQQDAVIALTRVIELGMNAAKNYELRGRANFALSRYEKAKSDYEVVSKKDPQAKLTLAIADCHYNLKEYDKAITLYTQGITDAKNPFMVHYLRGLSYLRTKQFEKARDDGDAAIKLDEKSHRGYYLRASANYWLKNVQAAADDFKLVAEKAPDGNFLRTTATLYQMALLQHVINSTESKFAPEFEKGGPGLTDAGM